MMDFKIKGATQMIRSLEQIDIQEHSRARLLFEKVAANIEKDAKARAPKKSGTLRRSITHRVASTPMSIEARIGTDLKYAPWQEEGTGGSSHRQAKGQNASTLVTGGGIPAVHYLRDAYQANVGPFLAELTSIIHSLRW